MHHFQVSAGVKPPNVMIDEYGYRIPVVIDCGSDTCKLGFAGDDGPSKIFPSLVGRHKLPSGLMPREGKDAYVGNEAISRKDMLSIKGPVEKGVVKNWDDMEQLLHHAFNNELNFSSEGQLVLLTECARAPKASRERLTQIMFETLRVDATYLNTQSVLSLYASGRITGDILRSGHGVTHSVPVYEGHVLPHAIYRREIGGREVTESLCQSFREHSFGADLSVDAVKDIKEKYCYVAKNFDDELNKSAESFWSEKDYTLPDGQVLKIGSAQFRCPEALFEPSLIGKQFKGLHDMIHSSVMKCDLDIRNDLLSNIVLSGGNTMFEGFVERLSFELRNLSSHTHTVKLVAPAERKYSAFIGGSIVTALTTFQQMWITKDEYDNDGPSIVHRKCY